MQHSGLLAGAAAAAPRHGFNTGQEEAAGPALGVTTNGTGRPSASHLNFTRSLADVQPGQPPLTEPAAEAPAAVIGFPRHHPEAQRFALPLPPSLSNGFAVLPGIDPVPSATYRRWLSDAGTALLAQHPRPATGPVSLRLELHPPHGRLFDLDTRKTAILDLLTVHGVIPASRNLWVTGMTLVFVGSGAPCTLVMTPL